MPNYNNGKIYCIKSLQTDKIYIGSTIQKLCIRKAEHKKRYKWYLAGKQHYMSVFEIMKYDDIYIELIERYPCNSKEELTQREGKYIRDMECVNCNVAGRTPKMYYHENKKKVLNYQKEYMKNNDNREKVKKRQTKKVLCECGCEVRKYYLKEHKKSKKHFIKLGITK